MATVSAFLRTTSAKKDREVNLRFRLTDGRDIQLFYKSSLTILPRLWSNTSQAIKAKVAIDEDERMMFNRSVEAIKNKILDWYRQLPDRAEATSADLQEYMDDRPSLPSAVEAKNDSDFATAYDRFLSERKITQSRVAQLKTTKTAILRFERYMTFTRGEKYVFNYKEATTQTIRAFERFLTDEHKICALYPELYIKSGIGASRPVEQRGRNTISSRLIYLRAFFNWAHKEGLTEAEPFKGFTIEQAVYGTPIYITTAELNHLAEFPIKTPGLAKERDIFVFQCCIGCRYSDLVSLRGSNVNDGVVEYIARKTREGHPVTVRTPMNKLALAIYNKYKQSNPNDKLLPVATDQVYNRAIKKMFAQAGLDRWVQILDPKTREPRQERLCDVATSHMARRTFIGNIYRKVRDQNLVSEMTGHRAGSAAFARYRTIDDDMRRDMVAFLEEAESERRVQNLKEQLGIDEAELERRIQAIKEQLENSKD